MRRKSPAALLLLAERVLARGGRRFLSRSPIQGFVLVLCSEAGNQVELIDIVFRSKREVGAAMVSGIAKSSSKVLLCQSKSAAVTRI